jgi:hypothetical protein
MPKMVLLRCPWCRVTSSKKKPFHVGMHLDDRDNEVYKTICPMCTNIFYPGLQNVLREHPNMVKGVVWEDDINSYCRENFSEYIFKVKGIVPKRENCLDPAKYDAEVPEKYRR